MGKMALASVLDDLFAERVRQVVKSTIIIYSKMSELEAQKILDQWEEKGFLKVIKPLSLCKSEEHVVELISFIQDNPNRNK